MAIRNLIVGRTTDTGVTCAATVRIVGDGSNPLLASDCLGDVLPEFRVSFAANETGPKSEPLPIKAGTAIGKGFRATLINPSPAATLPPAVTETVGYEGSSASAAFYPADQNAAAYSGSDTDPYFAG